MSVLSREGAPWRNWSHNTARNASLEARRSKKHPRGLSGKRKLANLRIEAFIATLRSRMMFVSMITLKAIIPF